MKYFIYCLKNYFKFSGRATRSEYWYFVLFGLLFSLAAMLIDFSIGTFYIEEGIGIFSSIYTLAILIPSLAVTVRRLHDTNRSAWWLLISLIPIIGTIVLIVFYCQDSKEDNKYGVNPKKIILQQG
jgi:uncharacterized membrane protein YhaH (DUF805 family)